jgi:hypothetical protein
VGLNSIIEVGPNRIDNSTSGSPVSFHMEIGLLPFKEELRKPEAFLWRGAKFVSRLSS